MTAVILVGMNPRTRAAIPWDADAEIWTLNEAPSNAWLKRYDTLFQIHPRWDWDRRNNIADPNHPLYIKSLAGECLFCHGTGKVPGQPDKDCPYCERGQYVVPAHRQGKTIVMQDQNDDVPGCVRWPEREIIDDLKQEYFTSTLAHMLTLAIHERRDRITLYGWGMESDTEYAYQRPCVEYWVGYGRALGLQIEAPGADLFKGEHYGYTTWMQGYRSRLGARMDILRMQIRQAEIAATKAEGALEAITPFKMIPEVIPEWKRRFDEHFTKKNMVSFLRGTLKELENAIAIYDGYYGAMDGREPENIRDLIGLTYQLG